VALWANHRLLANPSSALWARVAALLHPDEQAHKATEEQQGEEAGNLEEKETEYHGS
jgi:hypothetical protein